MARTDASDGAGVANRTTPTARADPEGNPIEIVQEHESAGVTGESA